MHILVFITMFIIVAVAAAIDGDWSGIKAIGNVLLFIVLCILVALMLMNPAVFVVIIIIGIIICICCQ